jgi:hypothetical protein
MSMTLGGLRAQNVPAMDDCNSESLSHEDEFMGSVDHPLPREQPALQHSEQPDLTERAENNLNNESGKSEIVDYLERADEVQWLRSAWPKCRNSCWRVQDYKVHMICLQSFKRHEAWVDAVVSLAFKIGEHADGSQATVNSPEIETQEATSLPLRQVGAESNSIARPCTREIQTQQCSDRHSVRDLQRAQEEAAALLDSIAAGTLPGAETLWSDDENHT